MSNTRQTREHNSTRLLVMLLPFVTMWCLVGLSPFALMNAIAISIYLFIKSHSLLMFRAKTGRDQTTSNLVAWFVAWPGTNAAPFFSRGEHRAVNWYSTAAAVGELLLGATLLFLVAPRLRETNDIVCGWCALVGMALMLHFGFFRLLAIVWNHFGRNVEPIMKAPMLATSVADFWGNRWNLAFRDYAHVTIFSPLARRFNALTGTLLGFLFSGFIHELAISVPANAGYGLPTLYFVLQGIGVLLERIIDKTVVRIRGNWLGWCWSVVWVLIPAPLLLFHLPFIRTIVLPIVDFVAF